LHTPENAPLVLFQQRCQPYVYRPPTDQENAAAKLTGDKLHSWVALPKGEFIIYTDRVSAGLSWFNFEAEGSRRIIMTSKITTSAIFSCPTINPKAIDLGLTANDKTTQYRIRFKNQEIRDSLFQELTQQVAKAHSRAILAMQVNLKTDSDIPSTKELFYSGSFSDIRVFVKQTGQYASLGSGSIYGMKMEQIPISTVQPERFGRLLAISDLSDPGIAQTIMASNLLHDHCLVEVDDEFWVQLNFSNGVKYRVSFVLLKLIKRSSCKMKRASRKASV
jgi:hypothetical protein